MEWQKENNWDAIPRIQNRSDFNFISHRLQCSALSNAVAHSMHLCYIEGCGNPSSSWCAFLNTGYESRKFYSLLVISNSTTVHSLKPSLLGMFHAVHNPHRTQSTSFYRRFAFNARAVRICLAANETCTRSRRCCSRRGVTSAPRRMTWSECDVRATKAGFRARAAGGRLCLEKLCTRHYDTFIATLAFRMSIVYIFLSFPWACCLFCWTRIVCAAFHEPAL